MHTVVYRKGYDVKPLRRQTNAKSEESYANVAVMFFFFICRLARIKQLDDEDGADRHLFATLADDALVLAVNDLLAVPLTLDSHGSLVITDDLMGKLDAVFAKAITVFYTSKVVNNTSYVASNTSEVAGNASEVADTSEDASNTSKVADNPERPFDGNNIMAVFLFVLSLDVPRFSFLGRQASPSSSLDKNVRDAALQLVQEHPLVLKPAYAATSDMAKIIWLCRAHVFVKVVRQLNVLQSSDNPDWASWDPAEQAKHSQDIIETHAWFVDPEKGMLTPHIVARDIILRAFKVAAAHPRPATMSMLDPSNPNADGSRGVVFLDSNLIVTETDVSRGMHAVLDDLQHLEGKVLGGMDPSWLAQLQPDGLGWEFPALTQVDDRGNRIPGTSFMSQNGLVSDEIATRLLRHHLELFLNSGSTAEAPAIGDLPMLYERGADGTPRLNRDSIRRYLEVIDQMRISLGFGFMVVPCGPRRASEAVMCRISNSANGTPRNMFYLSPLVDGHGMLEHVGGYHKNRNSGFTYGDKDVVRPLGQELSARFIIFNVLILSFEILLRMELGNAPAEQFSQLTEYQFCYRGKQMTEEQFARHFFNSSVRFFDKPLGIRDHRHLNAYLTANMRQRQEALVRGSPYDVLAPPEDEDGEGLCDYEMLSERDATRLREVAAASRGHKPRTGVLTYGRTIEEFVPGVPSDRTQAERQVGHQWESLMMINRVGRLLWAKRKEANKAWNIVAERKVPLGPDGRPVISSRTPHGELEIREVLGTTVDTVLAHPSLKQQPIKVEANVYLQVGTLGPAPTGVTPTAIVAPPFEARTFDPVTDHHLLVENMDVQVTRELRRTLPSGMDQIKFRSGVARLATALAASGRCNVLAVLPTGAGKSNLMVAAGLASQSVVLILVPYVVITPQIKRIIERTGADVAEYSANLVDRAVRAPTTHSSAKLKTARSITQTKPKFILLSYQHGLEKSVLDVISKIHHKWGVSLVCLDEVHVISLDAAFRDMQGAVVAVRNALPPTTPLFMLTATASPTFTRHLMKQIGLVPSLGSVDVFAHGSSNGLSHLPVRFFRESTVRKNIAFLVAKFNESDPDYVIENSCVDYVLSAAAPPVVIFVHSVQMARIMVEKLRLAAMSKPGLITVDNIGMYHANLTPSELPSGVQIAPGSSNDSASAKAALIQAVNAGTVLAVVTTEALGTGLDIILNSACNLGGFEVA